MLNTSALIGPSTIVVISFTTSVKSLPYFAIREGLVVTPQTPPRSLASFISSMLAVSIKNLILCLLKIYKISIHLVLYIKPSTFSRPFIIILNVSIYPSRKSIKITLKKLYTMSTFFLKNFIAFFSKNIRIMHILHCNNINFQVKYKYVLCNYVSLYKL